MDVLNQRAIELMRGDQAQLNRVLLAVCANTPEISYMDAYQELQDAAVDNPAVTVRDVLSGRKLDAIETDVKTLAAAGAASQHVRERMVRMLDLPAVDRHGRVRLLDQGGLPPRRTPTGTPDNRLTIQPDTYERVMNAPLHSERLHRARALTGDAYLGPDGAQRWQTYDRQMADGGADAVATLEAGAAARTAGRAEQLATSQLDAAFQNGSTPKERAKLLSKALKKTARLLDAMEQPADHAEPAAKGWSDRTMLLHSEVQDRRRQSGRGYLVELSAMSAEGL
jgi:hypothetical protein